MCVKIYKRESMIKSYVPQYETGALDFLSILQYLLAYFNSLSISPLMRDYAEYDDISFTVEHECVIQINSLDA